MRDMLCAVVKTTMPSFCYEQQNGNIPNNINTLASQTPIHLTSTHTNKHIDICTLNELCIIRNKKTNKNSTRSVYDRESDFSQYASVCV